MPESSELIEAISAAADETYKIYEERISNRHGEDWLGGSAIVSAPILECESFKAAVALVENYPGLAEIFAIPDGETQAFLWVNGQSQTVASGLGLVSNALNHAAIQTLWSPQIFNKADFVANCRSLAETVAAWAANKAVEFTVLQAVGVYNVFLRSNASIETPWGTLIPSPNRPQPPQVYTDGNIYLQFSAYSGDGLRPDRRDWPATILLQEEKVRVTTKEAEGKQPFTNQIADQVIEKLAFAIVLAVGDSRQDAPVYGGSGKSDPINGGWIASIPSAARQGMRVLQVATPEQEAELTNYARKVGQAPNPVLFAGRRLVKAINASTAEDALVDAVVVWEVIFGAAPETSYRVTSAVAKTLFPLFKDDVTEMELQKWLGRIYGLRSDIVHGNPERLHKDPKKFAQDMLNARRWSRLLLIEAFKWDPSVLASSSQDRSARVLLDPNWPNPAGIIRKF